MLEPNGNNLPLLKERLGVSEDPFSPRVSVFYEGAQRRHNLETLRHLSVFGDMVLLLIGDKGSGKTALIDQFSKNFSSEIDLLRLSAGEGSERINSIVRLAAVSGLEISPKDPAQDILEHLIDKYAAGFEKSGKRTLVVIDDAHALPPDELLTYLRVMGSLDPESGAVLALVGLPVLMHEVMAYEHPDRDDWLHQIQLKPLSVQDTLEYLVCRLEAVGHVGDVPLDPHQLEQLHSLARGMPGLIGESFSSILLGTAEISTPSAPATSRVPQYALYSICMLLVLSFAFVSYQHGFFETGGAKPEVLNVSSVDDAREKAERLARIEKAIAESAVVNEAVLEPVLMLDTKPESGRASESRSLVESSGSAATAGVLIEQEHEVALVDKTEANSQGSGDIPSHESAATESVSKPEPVDQVSASKPAELSAPSANMSEPRKPEVARKIEVKKERPVAVSEASELLYRSKAWVLSQKDSSYTAQVLGSYNEQTALRFVQRHLRASPQLYYVKTQYKGRDWFVVLYGSFETKRLAAEALKAAKKGVKAQKPWLRSFAGIKNSFAK